MPLLWPHAGMESTGGQGIGFVFLGMDATLTFGADIDGWAGSERA